MAVEIFGGAMTDLRAGFSSENETRGFNVASLTSKMFEWIVSMSLSSFAL